MVGTSLLDCVLNSWAEFVKVGGSQAMLDEDSYEINDQAYCAGQLRAYHDVVVKMGAY